MTPFSLFLLFVKYSALCFGGGYVLIPLLSADLVGAPPRPLSPELFSRIISVSQVTPGPVFINVATFVGFQQAGFFGSLGATCGAVLLSAPLVILAVKLLRKYESGVLVRGFFRGMRPASFGLILAAAWIFFELSVLGGPVPWFEPARISELKIDFAAAGIFAAALVLLGKTKINLTLLLIAAAVAGAFLCR
ncbi:MAG: chromate transporter [Lentisphaeria bacterium]|nr:chromate transporter [Lentisphaeria bacterium]